MSKNSQRGSGPVSLPGAHRQIHQRANGWALYYYAWRGGPLMVKLNADSRQALLDAEAAAARTIAEEWLKHTDTRPAIGVLARVVSDYMAHPAFTDLKKATKATYRVWLNRITEEFGHLSERDITDDRVSAWLKRIYAAHGARARDHALRVLSRLASWARHPERKYMSANFEPTKGFETLYRAPPQATWEPEWIERIAQIQREEVRWALMLALNTGLRRADLVSLPWSAVDERAGYIRWLTSKGSRYHRRVNIPLTPALRATLQAIPKRSTIILTNKWGRPWTVNSLGHAVTTELQQAKIAGTLHGLRRYAATNWAAMGWSSRKIAKVMGWSESEAEAMGAIYIDDEREVKLWMLSQANRQSTD